MYCEEWILCMLKKSLPWSPKIRVRKGQLSEGCSVVCLKIESGLTENGTCQGAWFI